MFTILLKRSVTIVLFLVFGLIAQAQQIHFVYLQTESEQPFYVKLDNKIISSSLAGYVIIPNLTDGDYKISIGFPKNEFPEENFKISVSDNNEGFLLKNFGEKGWGLFNLESLAIIMRGDANAADTNTTSKNLLNDPFSKMLANVVKDSSILQKNTPAKEPLPIAKVDSSSAIVSPDKEDSTSLATKKLMSKEIANGVEMVYVDREKDKNDTVHVYITSDKVAARPDSLIASTLQNTVYVGNPKNDSSATKSGLPESHLSDTSGGKAPVFLNQISTNVKKDTANTNKVEPTQNVIADTLNSVGAEPSTQPSLSDNDSVAKEANKIAQTTKKATIKENIANVANTGKDKMEVLPRVITSSTVNSDCKSFADNEDFLKLRKKMAGGGSDDHMIAIAKKAFRSKCFSTEQIKNLSFLFLTDQGRYRFFDAAYAFASDSDQYYTLQSQLIDPYYINRFKAMIHK